MSVNGVSKEKYLVIEPDGSFRWITTTRDRLLSDFYDAIGCDCLENVRSIVPDVCLIVDESGKIKIPRQEYNEKASQFYLGYWLGEDAIVGPAILAAIHLVDGEPDWVPLNHAELQKVISFLGIELPEVDA